VPFSDKDFSKAMQKIKDRNVGNQPPKKPASAYILYQKEVSIIFEKIDYITITIYSETSGDFEKETTSQSH
jgi:hypothetical protein